MKSLANIFQDLVYHLQAHDNTPRSRRDLQDYEWWARHPSQDPDVIQVAQKREEHQSPAGPHRTAPTRQEIKDYLGQLADEYHLPRRLVYGAADAESSFDPSKVNNNYKRDHNHKIVNDEHGNPIIKSKDYGLMQINSPRIGHDVVKDPNGHSFKIDANVIHDWKANARAGVAIIKHGYDLVSMLEGPGASSEDIALGTYSYYNHDHRWHKFIDRDKHGVPKDGAVRNFYDKYRNTPER